MIEKNESLDKLFCCPLCKGGLTEAEGHIRCNSCQKGYPKAGTAWDFRTVFLDEEHHWDAEAFDTAYSAADGGYEDGMEHALRAGIPRCAEEYRQGKKERLLKDFAKERQPSRILDLGCGCGCFSFELAKLCPKTIFYGIDISTFRVNIYKKQIAAEDAGSSMEAAAANGEKLPFPDGSFELVVLREVLEHLQAPGETLREIHRVLAPGGVLLISTPTKLMTGVWRYAAIPPTLLKRILRGESLFRKAVAPVYDEPLPKSKFEKIAKATGFVIRKWKRVIFLPHESYLQFIPNMLLRVLIKIACLIEKLPFCAFLGLHHVVFLEKDRTAR
ncbi:MAG: hypothetical protein A2X49_03860 [Lentisphaerae bacterium GWF2_52_8]|nr:MAG: hypothetical protein A2X49_03860 [Lentisphaerae bacterium GWF2_52_8]